jgi:hypothetical protein
MTPHDRKGFFKNYYAKPKAESPPLEHFCEAPHCVRPAAYKAPKSRKNIEEHQWFCEEHIREYNAHWDYLKGLSPKEIEAEIRADVFWRKPTWQKINTFKTGDFGGREDIFGLFQNQEDKKTQQVKPKESLPEELLRALEAMKLSFPITAEELKRVYKQQVKQYHPDVNGGSKEAEEMLKRINIAVRVIENFLGHARA